MIKCQPIIAVKDVETSSKWYQELLSAKGGHGGPHFEMLFDENNQLFMCLHAWEEHEHPTTSRKDIVSGNGLILYLSVKEIDTVYQRALQLGALIEKEPAISKNSHRREFAFRDPDGYYLLITE